MSQPTQPDETPNPAALELAGEIDARGLRCPLPLLKAKQGLNRLQAGQYLLVRATDAGSVRDFHSFATLSGHRLVRFVERNGEYEYTLRKS